MTQPRYHVPGQVCSLTRRCLSRCYFLCPGTDMNSIVAFEIARAAVRYNIVIHTIMVMSNHLHIDITDNLGMRSYFMKDAMAGIARARNHNLKRTDRFWNNQPYGDTLLLDADAVFRKVLYTLLNPVVAGLVERAEDWPGFVIMARHWGKTIRIPRPDTGYYGRKTPEYIEITPQPAPCFGHLPTEEAIDIVETALREKEDELIVIRKGTNQQVLGAQKILEIDPFDSPKTEEPFAQISPRFATTNKELMRQAQERRRNFLHAYVVARKKWLKGDKKVCFPCGTVWFRQCKGVKHSPYNPREPGLACNM